MSRRLILILALCALALAAVACFPWTLASDGPAQTLARQLRRDYGLDVSIHGESTLALLPTPRIKVENVEITGLGNRLTIRNATLRGGISFLALLRGQVELSNLALTDAATTLDTRGTDDAFWARWAAWLQLRSNVSPIKQLVISNGALTVRREKHPDIVIEAVNTTAEWPENTAPLSLAGDLRWNGKTVTIAKASLFPSALLSGKSGPFALEVSIPEGKMALSGTILSDRSWNVSIDGKSLLRLQSLSAITEWANLPVPLSPLIEAFAIEGLFSSRRNLVSWPSVNITLGEDKLEGSLSLRFDATAPTVSGTLAAEDIDLGRYLSRLLPAQTPVLTAPLSYGALNRADLDLRLSANTARLGSLRLTDLALGLIVKPDRLEAALGRASLDRGVLKGRLLMTGPVVNREVKLQGSVENLNLDRVSAAFERRIPLSGLARGQIALEGTGATLQQVLRNGHGKMALAVANGEIKGIDLMSLLRRMEGDGKPALDGSGSTSFTGANLGMIIESGVGFVTDGTIHTNGPSVSLNGDISLAEGTMAINAVSSRPDAQDGKQLVITAHGPWASPQVDATVQDKPKPQRENPPPEQPLPDASKEGIR